MSIINEPPVTVGPLYAPKTIELCVPGDPVCSGADNLAAHRQYDEAGMVDQAADFAASQPLLEHELRRPGPAAAPARLAATVSLRSRRQHRSSSQRESR